MAAKPAGMDTERDNVTVSLCMYGTARCWFTGFHAGLSREGSSCGRQGSRELRTLSPVSPDDEPATQQHNYQLSQTFTVTSEHIRIYFLFFLFHTF